MQVLSILGLAIALFGLVWLSCLLIIRLTGGKRNGKMRQYEKLDREKTGRDRQNICLGSDIYSQYVPCCPFYFLYRFIIKPFMPKGTERNLESERTDKDTSQFMDNIASIYVPNILQGNSQENQRHEIFRSARLQSHIYRDSRGYTGLVMHIKTLDKNQYLPFWFDIYDPKYPAIRFKIQAERKIEYRLLDAENYFAYKNKNNYKIYGKDSGKKEYDVKTVLPHDGKWVIMIMNKNRLPIEQLQYHVEYLG